MTVTTTYDMSGFFFAVWLIGWFPSALFAGWLALEKGRLAVLWFVLGCVFGIAAMLAVGLSPDRRDRS